jgi:hypothetical protein
VKRRALPLGLIALATAIGAALPAQALAGPLYDVHAYWADTNLPPGGEGQFVIQGRNIGDAAGSEDIVIEDQLPAGVTVKSIRFEPSPGFDLGDILCAGKGTSTAACLLPGFILEELAPPPGDEAELVPSGYLPTMSVAVKVAAGLSATATNTATLSGGSAATVTDLDQVPFASSPAAFAITPGSFGADFYDAAYPATGLQRQAGARPFETRLDFDLTRYVGTISGRSANRPHGTIKTAVVSLPHGLVGNPEATPKCNPADFAEANTASAGSTACPPDTQVGYVNVTTNKFIGAITRLPLYSLVPPKGQIADLAVNATGLIQAHIYPSLDPANGYAPKVTAANISSLIDVLGAEATIWGVPADPAHDRFRAYPKATEGKAFGAPWGSAPIRPLVTNPLDCGFDNGGAKIRVDSYQHPGQFTPALEYPDPLNVSGCDDPRFRFEPDVSVQPSAREAGAPTGLDVDLEVPQRDDRVKEAKDLYAQNGNVKAIPTPPLKKAVVTFPAGMTVSPSAAQGLGSCSPAQISLGTDAPVRCPDDSRYGAFNLRTPILPADEQLHGTIFIAAQNDNPFHNFLSFYLVVQNPERGILTKIPGRVDLDQTTGQLKVTLDDLPQLPFSDIELNLKGGLRAALVNPGTCGVKTITATFYSWQEPTVPHTVKDHFEVSQNQDGSPCHNNLSERPFDPKLSGGTVNNLAGAFSPLELQLTRTDEDQELSRVEGIAPPGLLASLKGVGRCTDAQIAAAANPLRTGTEELSSPSCPASSQVGTVDAGTGVGQVLTYVAGKVYLAGPYRGAPLSGVAIVPALAGPFDLGVIVTRAPAYVNAKTAQLRLLTDPLPQIFKGVPVRVRDIRVHIDREDFTLNPTNCEAMGLKGTLFSSEGKSKEDQVPFQAAECASLGFKPKLFTRLYGGTHRGAHPKFRGTLKARKADANLKSATIALPRTEFLDQGNIKTICTRAQFAQEECPKRSIYGHASAKTPLLEETLRGPVYLRSSNHTLPDLVAELHGLIEVEVVGRIDSIKGQIRANFESIPDAPVQSFTIAMQGGAKGLLVNSKDICAHAFRLKAHFGAQNGREATLHPKLKAPCGERKAKGR